MVRVVIDARKADAEIISRLQGVVLANPGDQTVIVEILSSEGTKMLRMGEKAASSAAFFDGVRRLGWVAIPE